MYQRPCRLTIASTYYGGAPEAPQRNLGGEFGGIKDLERRQRNQYFRWYQPNVDPETGKVTSGKADPLLRLLYPKAQEFLKSPQAPIISEMERQGLGLLTGGPSEGIEQLREFGLNQLEAGPSPWLAEAQTQSLEDLQARGALNAEQMANATQRARASSAQLGSLYGNQNIARELLNREEYRAGREQQARSFGLATEQLAETDVTRRFGMAQSGVQGVMTDLLQRFGLASGVAQQALGEKLAKFQVPQDVLKTGVSTFTALTNPLLAYASDLFSSNQNAKFASETAAANKTSGAIGTGVTILGAAATAY